MAKNKGVNFNEGDRVAMCPKALKCPEKSGQISSRTGLSHEELKTGPFHIAEIPGDGQLHVKHPRLGRPFILHSKFVTPYTSAA